MKRPNPDHDGQGFECDPISINSLINDLDYDSALRNLDHLLLSWPSAMHGTLYYFMGLTYQFQGSDLELAIEHFETAVTYGSGNRFQPYFFLGEARSILGRHKGAVLAMERMLVTKGQDNPKHTAIYLTGSASVLFHAGRVEEARQQFELAWDVMGESDPEFFPALFVLLGEPERARQILANTERKWPNGDFDYHGWINPAIFWGYFHLGEIGKALRWMEIGVEQRALRLIGDLKWLPLLNELRDHPRFARTVERLQEMERCPTPTRSVATECYFGPDARPHGLVSCARPLSK